MVNFSFTYLLLNHLYVQVSEPSVYYSNRNDGLGGMEGLMFSEHTISHQDPVDMNFVLNSVSTVSLHNYCCFLQTNLLLDYSTENYFANKLGTWLCFIPNFN